MTNDAPRAEYERRLDERLVEEGELDRRDRRLGDARLVVFILLLVAAWPSLVTVQLGLGWFVAPLLVFVTLLVVHAPVIRRLKRLRRGIAFYERGLARLTGERPEPLDDGKRFRPEDHPYAVDLDLFGAGSLYGLLCTARSLPGRERLAAWLLNRAEPDNLTARHEAVRELRGRLDLHEDLAVLAAELSPELQEEKLAEWGRAPARLSGLWVPLVAPVLGLVNLATMAAWIFGPLEGKFVLAVLAVSVLLVLALRGKVVPVLAGLDMPAGELRFLAATLERLENESFESARLATLHSGDEPASARLAGLARLIEWNDSRSNQFFVPLASLMLAGTQLAFAVERWRARNGAELGGWLRVIGDVEALGALATFSYENPDYPFPELAEGPPRFEARDLVHPLLPRSSRVANDLALAGANAESQDEPSLLLISGSNMSGKSTLLRTVGVAAALAFAGAPVPARSLVLTPMAIGASLQVHDSLLAGVSRFYAELQQISRVRKLAARGPTLFLLDEILHGTNSHDRRLGAAGVIHALLEAGAIGLVTTHDLALAEVADDLGGRAANVHFEDHLAEGAMAFDYRLRPGVVARGNALALMRSLDLPVEDE